MEIQYHKTLEEIIQLQKVLDETNVRLMDAKRGREEEDDEDEANEDEVEEVKVTNTTTITDEGIDENKNPEDDVVDPVKNKVENDTNDTENDRTDNGSNVMDQTIKSMMKNEKKNKKMKRHEKLIMLQQIQNEKLQIQKDINSLKEYDPVVIANYEKEYDYVMKAANRWTDNIFNCKSYLMKKRNVDKKDANRILGINDTFDCKFQIHFFFSIYTNTSRKVLSHFFPFCHNLFSCVK